jgi:fumarate reductase flavoprotein subunit
VTIRTPPKDGFEASAPVVVVGAGAAGFCAALALHELGVEVAVLERDSIPRGSTALSAGLIPAAGTRFQAAIGVRDDPALFAADLRRKAHDRADAALVDLVAQQAGPAVKWLAACDGLPFSIVPTSTIPATPPGGCMACPAARAWS